MSNWCKLQYNKDLYATHIYTNKILAIKGLIDKETTQLNLLIKFDKYGQSTNLAIIFIKNGEFLNEKIAEIDIKNRQIISNAEKIKIKDKEVVKELKKLKKYAKQVKYMDIFGGRCMKCNRKTEADICFCRECLETRRFME